MELSTILLKKEGAIATITINRAPMNPLNEQFYRDLITVADDLLVDDAIKAVILTGAGDKAFAAGSDVAEMVEKTAYGIYQFCTVAMEALSKIENLHKPVIAVIKGFCLGGGLELAMACDFRFASDKASLGLPELGLGIMPGTGGSQRMSRLIGVSKAKELIYMGDVVDAAKAEKLGLVNKVFAPDALDEEAAKFAKKLSSKATVAMKMVKECINTGSNMDIASALKLEIQYVATVFASEDGREGMKAFMEKRKPAFTGK